MVLADIDRDILEEFLQYLKEKGIEQQFHQLLGRLNTEEYVFFLSTYSKLDYIERYKLSELYSTLQLAGTTYELILSQLQEISTCSSLSEVVSLYPTIGLEVAELLYLQPEKIATLLAHQQAELSTYSRTWQKMITEQTIKVYLAISQKTPMFSYDFNKVFRDYKIYFDNNIDDMVNLEIAKRVTYLQKTIQQLCNTSLCLISVNVTGLVKPKPVQISCITVNSFLEITGTYNWYIAQDKIDGWAVKEHGITTTMLTDYKVTPIPTVVQNLNGILKQNTILISHNADFTKRVLGNLYKQVGRELPDISSICIHKDINQISEDTNVFTLEDLMKVHRITPALISNEVEQLGLDTSLNKKKNPVKDIVSMFLFLKDCNFIATLCG